MYEKKETDGSITLTGYRLKFYYDEKERFPEAYHKQINNKATKIIYEKLKKHYKLNTQLRIGIRTRINGHFRAGYLIDLPHKNSIGLLAHEISHAIDHKKRGESKHDKKLMKIMTKVINYCKKKNYWEEEITRRTKPKQAPNKPYISPIQAL